MRTVTKSLASAFLAKTAKRDGSTVTDGSILTLHGHTIARHVADGIEFNFCGWVTSTTCERINGVARLANLPQGVSRAKGAHSYTYTKGERIELPSQGWFRLDGKPCAPTAPRDFIRAEGMPR